MQALETGKFQKVTIYMSFDFADLQVVGQDASTQWVDKISTRDLPALIKKMMDAGITVEFGTTRRFEWAEFVLDNIPLVLLIIAVSYILYLRRKVQA